MTKTTVGSDVDAYCTKCKLVLNHVIVTMEGPRPRRVRCTTCSGVHNYRPAKPTPKAAAPKKEKPKTARTTRKAKQTWDEMVQQASHKQRKTYSIKGNYDEGDWIEHAKFGLGCVESFTAPNRITVRFANNLVKTLGCNY